MDKQYRRGARRVDGDGVRFVQTSSRRKSVALWMLALAALLVTTLVALRWLRPSPPEAAPLASAATPRVSAEAPRPAERPRLAPPAPPAKTSPAETRPVRAPEPEPDPEPAGEPPKREDPPVGFGPPGSGMALFPPPGTEPLRSGILVPDDFPLPEGYVRHHQATDDGELLPAILMFHPDYEWIDEAGEPIALPGDRIVPPELAPPGLPIRMLELPPTEGGAEPPR
jgi:hypothetical protein